MIERLGLSPAATPMENEAALWLVLVLPLLLGVLGAIARPSRAWPVAVAGLLPLLALGWLSSQVAGTTGKSGVVELGDLVLYWRVNGLTLLLLLLTYLIGLASALYAPAYLRDDVQALTWGQAWFWPLLGLLISSLALIWLAADLLSLYIGLELMGLTAVGLMLLPGKVEALVAGLRYLLLALVGSLAFLLGISLMLGAWGRLDLAGLAEVAEPGVLLWVAVGLLTGGLMLKAAAFPLHVWLVPVHAWAWIPVSAIHAGLVIKASFFIALQLWLLLVPEATVAAWMIGGLAGAAVVWGGVKAWRSAKLKEVVAWSTVSQLGYLLLAFPLLIGTDAAVADLAWKGTWLQLMAHGLAKAAMFLALGNLILATGAARVEGLAGASRRFPLSLLSFGMAAISVVGLPPSMGFTAKWLLLHAALSGGHWAWMMVLAVGTLLSAAYVFRLFHYSFIEDAPEAEFRRVPWPMETVALLLALAALLLGLAAEWPLTLLRVGGDEP